MLSPHPRPTTPVPTAIPFRSLGRRTCAPSRRRGGKGTPTWQGISRVCNVPSIPTQRSARDLWSLSAPLPVPVFLGARPGTVPRTLSTDRPPVRRRALHHTTRLGLAKGPMPVGGGSGQGRSGGRAIASHTDGELGTFAVLFSSRPHLFSSAASHSGTQPSSSQYITDEQLNLEDWPDQTSELKQPQALPYNRAVLPLA